MSTVTEVAFRKHIYLASGYGFSVLERNAVLPKLVDQLLSLNLQVFEPFKQNNFQGLTDAEVGEADADAIKNAGAVFAVLNGEPPDAGVMYEMGLAHGYGKRIFTFRDDWRICSDASSDYPVNLMAFSSHEPADSWRDHHYTTLDSITDKSKALYQWATEVEL